MYALRASRPHTSIQKYVRQQRIASIAFDDVDKAYYCDGKKRGGLTRALKDMYYPSYTRLPRVGKRRWTKKRRRASSKEQGKLIDDQITAYVATGRVPDDCYAQAIVQYLEHDMGHRLEAAQLPLCVQVGAQERVTQADVITSDPKGRLWMWEVKSGWNQVQAQGVLRHIKGKVPCKDHTHWELQRHYTHQGLVNSGLKIYKSHVLNVFIEGDHTTVQRRSVPKWTKNVKIRATPVV